MENKLPEKPAENARDEFLYPGSAPRREPAGKVTSRKPDGAALPGSQNSDLKGAKRPKGPRGATT